MGLATSSINCTSSVWSHPDYKQIISSCISRILAVSLGVIASIASTLILTGTSELHILDKTTGWLLTAVGALIFFGSFGVYGIDRSRPRRQGVPSRLSLS